MRSRFYHFRSPGGADGRALRPAVRPVLVWRQRRRGVCERNRQPGEPVTGLTEKDFDVLEDGKPQTVSVFSAGDFPLSVAVALDRSFSMAGPRLATARSAARVFLGELRAQDEAAILAIGSRVETVAPLSTDRAAQFEALARIDAFGTTGLYDSVVRAIELTQPAKGRRALVVLSDGVDRYSTTTAERRSSRRAVPMSSCTRSLSPSRRRHSSSDSRRSPAGGAYHVPDPAELLEDAPSRCARAAFSVPARLRAACHGDDRNGGVAPYYCPCQAAGRHRPSARRIRG